MSLNWIRIIEKRVKWLFGEITQSRSEAQRDLARLTALNESVQEALKESSTEKALPDSVHVVRQVEIEAALAKLKIDMSGGFDRGTGMGGSDPFSSARVPRRPLPTNGSGEIALPLPEPEPENEL